MAFPAPIKLNRPSQKPEVTKFNCDFWLLASKNRYPNFDQGRAARTNPTDSITEAIFMIRVSENFSVKKNTPKENSSISLDRNLQAIEARVAHREKELLQEIGKLKSQLAVFEQQNKALHHCWQEVIDSADTSAKIALGRAVDREEKLAAQLDEAVTECLNLRARVRELEGHLNPRETLREDTPLKPPKVQTPT